MTRNLLYFNPGHEAAILNGSPYYMPPANVAKMQKDLAYLPAWLGSASDYVFIEENVPQEFSEYLSRNLNPIPQGITPTLLQSACDEISVRLWGISPQAIHYFRQIELQYKIDLQIDEWNDTLKLLSSRQTARKVLLELTERIADISTSIVPQFYSQLVEIEETVKLNNSQFLAKAPYSSSGRGLLWLPVAQLTRTEKQILHGILKKQGSVSLERVLAKKLDFAMEFKVSEQGKVNFEGYSLFKTNSKGAYLGNYLGTQASIADTISAYISRSLLEKVKDSLTEVLQSVFGTIYVGCIGVDMMLYDEDGICKLHPCLEINVRNNMGLLAIKISENHIHPDSEGSFYIDFSSEEGEIYRRDRLMKEEFPARFSDRKIKAGYLSLCPVYEHTNYRAYIMVK